MTDDGRRYGYEALKAMGKRLGRSAASLYALAPANDPFYAGSPANRAGAEWFAELWHRFGLGAGVHLRRIHYRLVSQETPVRMLDGKPYENTVECWSKLTQASKAARYLDLVALEDFTDRRNPPPQVFLDLEDADPDVWVDDTGLDAVALPWGLPDLPVLSLNAPAPAQRFHIEMWCEKSTANEILIPLGERYKANVVTGVGEFSVPACQQLLERAVESGRPVRVLYISDFDPAGLSMPVAVARKVEFLHARAGHDLDLQVRPIVLTHEQCVAYRLPRTPIKETERRAGRFEERFGAGATELDALEALHPGELRRILAREIGRYFDDTLGERILEHASDVRAHLETVTTAVHGRHTASIDALRVEYTDLRRQVEAWHARAGTVWQAITDDLEAEAPACDDGWPESDPGNEDPDPLFDSTRDYLDQIARYKRHQGKAAAGEPGDDEEAA